MKNKENFAVSVPDECWKSYSDGFVNMPEDVRKKLSCHMIKNIFDHMVIPAINKARGLDREYVSELDITNDWTFNT